MPITPKTKHKKSIERGGNVPEHQIQRAHEFWQMNQTAEYASQQPNTPGRDSCYKLFNEWDNKLRKDYDIDTNERQIMAKEKLTVSFRRLIGKLEYQLNKFENIVDVHYNKWLADNNTELAKEKPDYTQIEEYKPFMNGEWMVRDLTKALAELQDSMAVNITVPTVYEESESTAIEHLRKKSNELIIKANDKITKHSKSKKKKQPKK